MPSLCHIVNRSFSVGNINRLRISSRAVNKCLVRRQGLGRTTVFIPFIWVAISRVSLIVQSSLWYYWTWQGILPCMWSTMCDLAHKELPITQWLEPLSRKQWVDWIRRTISVKYMPRWIPWIVFAAAPLAPSDRFDVGYRPRMRSRLLYIALFAKFFFVCLNTKTTNTQRKSTMTISNHLDETSLVNRVFLIGGKEHWKHDAELSECARKRYLARSCSQSQRRIWLSQLPTYVANHIILDLI